MNKGIVYLVGAGPGDPKLISLRGLECVKRADVLIFDRLANRQLLDEAKKGSEIIYVGKKGGNFTVEQSKINELMVEKAREGKSVARLKGGDGFIFGRGGEEAIWLKRSGVRFEVVPGISSAYSVPAYAGIPVTHRGISSSVAFITGHEDMVKKESSLNWEKIATATDTIVFLMGMKNLGLIVRNLIENGRPENTPVAVIRWGTTPRQKTVIGTLGTIIQDIHNSKISPPAITVVGEVVNLRNELDWFENKPLFGKKIVITRALDQSAEFCRKIEELGAYVIRFPTIITEAVHSSAQIDSSIANLQNGKYAYIIFTSANAVKYLFNILSEKRLDLRILGNTKIAAIGKATAKSIESLNLIPDLIPESFVAESAVEGLVKKMEKGQRALFPKAAQTRDIIPDKLGEAGIAVDELTIYKTVLAEEPSSVYLENLLNEKPDYITFTSSSTAKNFAKLLGRDNLREFFKAAKIVSIGPITTQTIKDLGFNADIEAKEFTTDGLLQAILKDIEAV